MTFLDEIPEWREKKKGEGEGLTREEVMGMKMSCFNLTSENLVKFQQVLLFMHRLYLFFFLFLIFFVDLFFLVYASKIKYLYSFWDLFPN